MGNPNMNGSRQWQAAAGEKPMDEYRPMNRQQKRALNAKMGSIADVPPSSNETKNLSTEPKAPPVAIYKSLIIKFKLNFDLLLYFLIF